MERQPIDDFFARKLREAEQLPSPDAFSRLQSRMVSTELPRKRRYVALWWYGAAASLLLITVFFYRSHVNPPIGAMERVAKLNKIEDIRLHRPKQKTEQLMAQAGEEPLLLHGKHEERSKSHESLTPPSFKQPTNREEAMVAVTVTRKLPAPNSQTSQKTVLLPPVLVEQEAIAITPRSSLSVHDIPPTGPAVTKVVSAQRVVVLTIDVPAVEAPIVALQATGVESTSQVQPGSLAGLFAKVKQLKNGDVLARATLAKRLVESRSRLGRVFEGMKESLKNETNLE